eukprot:TRINITY_DN26768_c0_g1_i1.p1 TRINITY_DN26768_c0_g1~~TRINITY_DN26768_c0_g1_i1.p1  ORF type:complete len:658 (+),score=89.56 TRINITY_DN26768_c0_g1_i1:70-2043(+)
MRGLWHFALLYSISEIAGVGGAENGHLLFDEHVSQNALSLEITPGAIFDADASGPELKKMMRKSEAMEKESVSAPHGNASRHGSSNQTQNHAKTPEDDRPKMQGKDGAIVLLCCAAAFMVCLYAVNFPDEQVRQVSWKCISQTICLVTALTLFDFSQDVLSLADDQRKAALEAMTQSIEQIQSNMTDPVLNDAVMNSSQPTAYAVGAGFARFAMSLFLMECLLFALKRRRLALFGWGTMAGHICNITCADAYASTQEWEPFRNSVAYSSLWTLITIASLAIITVLSQYSRERIAMLDEQVDEHEHAWKQQCEECEEGLIGFAVGLCIAQTIRFSITGRMDPFEGIQKTDNPMHIEALFSVAIGLCVVTQAMNVYMSQWLIQCPYRFRMIRITLLCCSYTMGWCFLFAGKWSFRYGMETMPVWRHVQQETTGFMIMAVILTMFGFAAIVGIEKWTASLRTRLNFLSEGFILAIAMSWETVLQEAVMSATVSAREDASEEDEDTVTMSKLTCQLKVTILICILILPGWFLYILPHSLPAVTDAANSQEGQINTEENKTGEGASDTQSLSEEVKNAHSVATATIRTESQRVLKVPPRPPRPAAPRPSVSRPSQPTLTTSRPSLLQQAPQRQEEEEEEQQQGHRVSKPRPSGTRRSLQPRQ